MKARSRLSLRKRARVWEHTLVSENARVRVWERAQHTLQALQTPKSRFMHFLHFSIAPGANEYSIANSIAVGNIHSIVWSNNFFYWAAGIAARPRQSTLLIFSSRQYASRHTSQQARPRVQCQVFIVSQHMLQQAQQGTILNLSLVRPWAFAGYKFKMFSIKQRASQDPVLSLFLCWAAGIAGYSFNRRLLLGNGCIKE